MNTASTFLPLTAVILLFNSGFTFAVHFRDTQEQFVDCPPGCSSSKCPPNVGCSLCNNGFCLHVNETTRQGECLKSCPDKYYCERIFLSVCKSCKDSNCEVCDSSGLCSTCLPGFTLSSATHTCSGAGSGSSTPLSVDLDQTIG